MASSTDQEASAHHLCQTASVHQLRDQEKDVKDYELSAILTLYVQDHKSDSRAKGSKNNNKKKKKDVLQV